MEEGGLYPLKGAHETCRNKEKEAKPMIGCRVIILKGPSPPARRPSIEVMKRGCFGVPHFGGDQGEEGGGENKGPRKPRALLTKQEAAWPSTNFEGGTKPPWGRGKN